MKLGLSLLAIGATATHISAGDDCLSDWIWEDCSQLYYQWDWCKWSEGEYGWWYSPELDDDWGDDWWVPEDEWLTWEECW